MMKVLILTNIMISFQMRNKESYCHRHQGFISLTKSMKETGQKGTTVGIAGMIQMSLTMTEGTEGAKQENDRCHLRETIIKSIDMSQMPGQEPGHYLQGGRSRYHWIAMMMNYFIV